MRQTPKSVSPFSNEARNAYVIEHITDALLTLLKDKPIGDISISELCDLAGIGRASVYRNFESKEDKFATGEEGSITVLQGNQIKSFIDANSGIIDTRVKNFNDLVSQLK